METKLSADALRPYEAATSGTMALWPAIGVLAGMLFASFHFDNPAVRGLATAVYVLGVFVAVGVQAKKIGVQPSLGGMPSELRKNMYAFWGAATLLAIAALALGFGLNFLVAGCFIAAAFAVLGVVYHRRSRRIVESLLASS